MVTGREGAHLYETQPKALNHSHQLKAQLRPHSGWLPAAPGASWVEILSPTELPPNAVNGLEL